MRSRSWLALVLALVLSWPGFAFGSAGPDDEIPGVTLPASPVVGSVDGVSDTYDVYAVDLAADEWFRFSVTSADEYAAFVTYLCLPESTSILDSSRVAGMESGTGSSSYLSKTAGTYYLVIESYDGTADYTIQWSTGAPEPNDDLPGVALTASPVSGYVDSYGDASDVYSVYLSQGQWLTIDVQGDALAWLPWGFVSVYSPDASSIWDPSEWIEPVASSPDAYGRAHLSLLAGEPGTYYVAVDSSWGGDGSYSLEWSLFNSARVVSVAGANRVDTAIATSQLAFPDGADHVVIATARDWPDALGGSALAGVLEAPLLLTEPGSTPSAVAAEIRRLGATHAYVLGGTGAVPVAVETAIEAATGSQSTRLAGKSRYETAAAIAAEVIDLQGDTYSGGAFVATGADFPDALGASPLAASAGEPIYLANPAWGYQEAMQAAANMNAAGVHGATVLGGTGAVSATMEAALGEMLWWPIGRLWGTDRYRTAVEIATHGVESYGLAWDRAAIATGENFPDALAGGVLQGRDRSVLLLTHTAYLDGVVSDVIWTNASSISEIRFLGGTGALSSTVRGQVSNLLY